QSNPIPITVSDVATPPEPLNKTTPETKLKPLEIEGNFSLDEGDLSNLWFGSWSVFQLIPFAILLLFFQYYIRSLIEKRRHLVLSMTPQELLAEANKQVDNPKVFFYYLTRALLKDLLAKGEISSIDLSPEQLPDCNHRTFLLKVQEQRYTGQPTERQILIDEASTLLQEMKA
ncbi:MAG: hypothetical protein KDK65_06785, partial [Chlamydiia bacterium]|nr:hypothetical protein [Chlamydiia bacterium]